MRIRSYRFFGLLLAAGAIFVPACVGLADGAQKELTRFEPIYFRMVDPKAPISEKRAQIELMGLMLARIETNYLTPVEMPKLIDAAIKAVEEKRAESDKPQEPAPAAPAAPARAETAPPPNAPPPNAPPPNAPQAPIQMRVPTQPWNATPTATQVMEVAMNGLMGQLDPHSQFMTPEIKNEMDSRTKGEFGGLGIEITQEEGMTKVITPMDDTPAFKAGIKAGDFITHAEGESLKGWTQQQVVRKLRGTPGTQITVTILRGDKSFDLRITRGTIVLHPVRVRMEGETGYIRVTTFSEQTESELVDAIKKIRREQGAKLKGLVLDLRNNSGGLLDQAVRVSDAFLEQGEIVSVKGRRGRNERYHAGSGDYAKGLPVVVLLNSGSASAAEIVAGALQDHGRAILIGSRSFGKGSVQTLIPFDGGYGLKLTTALYYTPSGRSIQSTGILPDLTIKDPEEKDVRRENTLANALPNAAAGAAVPAPAKTQRPEFDQNVCPEAGPDKKDRLLGCALSLIDAGNIDEFVARLPRTAQVQ